MQTLFSFWRLVCFVYFIIYGVDRFFRLLNCLACWNVIWIIDKLLKGILQVHGSKAIFRFYVTWYLVAPILIRMMKERTLLETMRHPDAVWESSAICNGGCYEGIHTHLVLLFSFVIYFSFVFPSSWLLE